MAYSAPLASVSGEPTAVSTHQSTFLERGAEVARGRLRWEEARDGTGGAPWEAAPSEEAAP